MDDMFLFTLEEAVNFPCSMLFFTSYSLFQYYQRTMNGDINSSTEFCFAVSGASFSIIRNHFPDLLPKVVTFNLKFLSETYLHNAS